MIMKPLFTFLSFFFLMQFINAQENPVTFTVEQQDKSITFNATIASGWHLYAANLPDPTSGPLPTEIVYNEPAPSVVGTIEEPKGHTEMDDAFGIEVKFFEEKTYFKQTFAEKPEHVSGTIYYMVCNDEMCIPLEYPFAL